MNQTEILHKLDRVNAQFRTVAEYEDNPVINSINDELAIVIQEYKESRSENKSKNFNVFASPYIDVEKLHQKVQTKLRKIGVDV